MRKLMQFQVYILHSTTLNRYYTGFTSNLETRMLFHLNSENKFTSKAKDWKIFHTILCETKSQALAIEKHIKKMKSRIYIENFKKYPEIEVKLLKKYKDC